MSTKTDWRGLAEAASDTIGYECRHTGVPDESVPGCCPECWELGGKIADAILAAGYRKPRTVTTVEELKTLEDPDAILVDYKRNAYQWGIGLDGSEGWQSTRDPNPITSNHLWRFAPITVLHEGSL